MGTYDYLKSYTAPALLRSALGKVTANVDKREGSVIFDTLSPLAVIAANVIAMMHQALSNTDLQTAQGQWLDLIASQPPCGLYRKQAFAAQKIALATPTEAKLELGSFFESEGLGLRWQISEALGGGRYILRCDTKGRHGGNDYGELTPIIPNNQLKRLEFEDIGAVVRGDDEESDEDFRLRIWASLVTQAYGGNFESYKSWVLNDFALVENGAKLDGMIFFPASRYLGGGHVLICPVLRDANDHGYMPASPVICDRLKAYLDPLPSEGMGAGVVPLGHRVEVLPPTTENLRLRVQVELHSGTTLSPPRQAQATSFLQALFEAVRRRIVTAADDSFPSESPAGYSFTITYGELVEAIIDVSTFKSVQKIWLYSELNPEGLLLSADASFNYAPTSTQPRLPVLDQASFQLDA